MLKRLEILGLPNIFFIGYHDDRLMISVDAPLKQELMFLIKNSSFFSYKQLLDIFVVDYPEESKRFQVNYSLLSLRFSTRLFFRVGEGDTTATCLSSIKKVFPSADWVERECWDMFGVFFSHSSSLRRILTDYGFVGHPLRRDFPLQGYTAVRWSPRKHRIVLQRILSTQSFRLFNFEMPWAE